MCGALSNHFNSENANQESACKISTMHSNLHLWFTHLHAALSEVSQCIPWSPVPACNSSSGIAQSVAHDIKFVYSFVDTGKSAARG